MFPETSDISFLKSSASSGKKSYLYDFTIGDFVVRDGKLVECDGLTAVKIWIEKILRTEKGHFEIYDGTEYGCHLEDLIIGNTYTSAFIESELKREIEDALLQHPDITTVTDFNITRNTNTLTIEMKVIWNDKRTDTITVTV